VENLMGKLLGEPVLVILGGGTALVQAVLHLLIVFNIPISPAQDAAITSVAGIILAACVRAQVTPNSVLPPGVPQQIADAKALKAAGD
jgi:hypothetical protein